MKLIWGYFHAHSFFKDLRFLKFKLSLLNPNLTYVFIFSYNLTKRKSQNPFIIGNG